jgi:3-(3-hydroxy-phenyl)propionate hydroxylase
LLNLPLDDLDFDEPWLVVDVLVNEQGLAKLPAVSVQYCEPDRPCTYVIGPRNHRRWEISLKPGEDPREVATDAATWKLLSRWITPADGTLWRQASYRFHALVAARWREGRVFLAGDAAHMQPPFLGQGMCQGVRDVANLAWKLDAVLQGRVQGGAAERLLGSYGAERSAHVRALTTRIKGVGAVICERDPVKARARDAQLLADCGGVVQDTPRQDVLPHLSTGLLAGPAHAPQGMLFPQPWVSTDNGGDGGRARLDTLAGHGWRLVLAPGYPAPAHNPTGGTPWTLVPLGTPGWTECDGVAASWFQKHQVLAALVRPDNYVYGSAADANSLAVLLDTWRAALGQSAMETT